MIRRRTAISVSAVALLAASPLLTACGSDAHAGAAAMVDGDRITVSQLQGQVKDVRNAQVDSPQAAQLLGGTSQLSRATLNSMIFDRVLARAAKDNGVSITRRDVQHARAEAEKASGGAARLRAMWLQQYAIAPSQIDTTFRNQLRLEKVSAAIGADRSTPEGQARLVEALHKVSSSMRIDVSPRFGTWDDKKVLLSESKDPWLRAAAVDAPNGPQAPEGAPQ